MTRISTFPRKKNKKMENKDEDSQLLRPKKNSDTGFRNRSTGWSLEHWLAIEWYSMEILKLPVQPGLQEQRLTKPPESYDLVTAV